jgi:hypothetical protein
MFSGQQVCGLTWTTTLTAAEASGNRRGLMGPDDLKMPTGPTREWCERMADLEDGCESVSAGVPDTPWQRLRDYLERELVEWEGRNADRFWQTERIVKFMEQEDSGQEMFPEQYE